MTPRAPYTLNVLHCEGRKHSDTFTASRAPPVPSSAGHAPSSIPHAPRTVIIAKLGLGLPIRNEKDPTVCSVADRPEVAHARPVASDANTSCVPTHWSWSCPESTSVGLTLSSSRREVAGRR